MIILLLQPTNNNNTNNPINPTHTNRVRSTMDSILIRNRTPSGTGDSILANKSSLHIVRRCTSHKPTNGLLSHSPAGNTKPEHGVALPTHPVLIVWDRAALCRRLKYHVEWGSAAERNGD